jgi:hypothetical protein
MLNLQLKKPQNTNNQINKHITSNSAVTLDTNSSGFFLLFSPPKQSRKFVVTI